MAKSTMDKKKKTCVTHEFRVSFPAVFEPKAFEDQKPKYSCVMLFDAKTDLGKPAKKKNGEAFSVSLKEAVMNAATEKWGKRETWPKNLRLPFRNGDEKSDTPGYAGTIFVTASTMQQPQVLSKDKRLISDQQEFYAGCYARAEVVAFAYDKMGNKGVSLSLQSIQKTRDGDPFSGRKDADDVFEEIEDDSDSESSYLGASEDTDLGDDIFA